MVEGILTKFKNNGGDENSNFVEEQQIENEISSLKSRLLQLDVKISALQNEEKMNSLQLNHMLAQEIKLKISILHQEQEESRGPLGNIETYLVAQLERSHKTLELERECCQFKLEATSKLMESKLELIEATNNFSVRNLNSEIDTERKRQKQNVDRIINLEEQLENAKTSYQLCNVQDAENSNIIINITEQLNISNKQKMDLSSENTRITAELTEKSRRLDNCLTVRCKTSTTLQHITWTPPSGTFKLLNGYYFFNGEKLNWKLARDYCRFLGMDLLAIESELENKLLADRAMRIWQNNFTWTSGCFSRTEDDAVVWQSTGDKVTYTNWGPGQGNKRDVMKCVVLHPGSTTWYEFAIDSTRPSICEKL